MMWADTTGLALRVHSVDVASPRQGNTRAIPTSASVVERREPRAGRDGVTRLAVQSSHAVQCTPSEQTAQSEPEGARKEGGKERERRGG